MKTDGFDAECPRGVPLAFVQTVVLGILMRSIGNKNTILLGLGFQILQLAWYGFGSQPWSVELPPLCVLFVCLSAVSNNAGSWLKQVMW